MSKNLYRINSKNDLNDLMSESYVKPIGIVFVNNTLELSYLEKLVDLIRKTAKVNNYMSHVIINLDDFEDTTGFFNDIKTKTLPFFISYFLLKEITRHESASTNVDKSETFLEDYSEIVSGVNDHYKNKLITYFTKQQDKPEKQDNGSVHTKKTENKSVHSLKSKILKSENKELKIEQKIEPDLDPELEQDIELQKQKKQLELLLKQREELEKMEE